MVALGVYVAAEGWLHARFRHAISTPTSATTADDVATTMGPEHQATAADSGGARDPELIQERAVQPIATVRHEPIAEISGIARSRTYPNVWWVHNDSGDIARLFAIDANGDVIIPSWLQRRYHGEEARAGASPYPGILLHLAANIDWEDIALSDGMLYIADMGNNGNARRDLGVYVVPEPNPHATYEMRVLTHYPVRYPDQTEFPAREWHFDCEGLFVDQGRLYFLTKHRRAGEINGMIRGTKLYRMDTWHTDQPNVLTLIDRANLPIPTAASLSPDGSKLAVLCYTALYVFERPLPDEHGQPRDTWLTHGSARRVVLPVRETQQIEAVCWDDDQTLRIANEQRGVFRVPLAALEPVELEPVDDQAE